MNKKIIILAIFTFGSIVVYSCQHISGTYISTYGSMAGRNMNGNCMDCHKTGATYGGFSIAGTLYRSDSVTRYPNGTIYFYGKPRDSTGADSTLIAKVQVDGVGNFYTTHPYDLSLGVYATVVSAAGDSASMQSPITNGSCNSCHGVIQGNVSVN